MKRQIPGLHAAAQDGLEGLEGVFLVTVDRALYRFHPQKPFFALGFAILEPAGMAGKTFPGRLYCTPKALWKLNWFLKDFGYDPGLLEREELDEKVLVGLKGVVKVSYALVNGRRYLNLDAFARAERWQEIQEELAEVS
jgi:hypothetical protein